MSDKILKIAPDPNPDEVAGPSQLAYRLNRLTAIGYAIEPLGDARIVLLKYHGFGKGVTSPLMLLGRGELCTSDGWPYELDRIFIAAGDDYKFERFIAGIEMAAKGWRGNLRTLLGFAWELLPYLIAPMIGFYLIDLAMTFLGSDA